MSILHKTDPTFILPKKTICVEALGIPKNKNKLERKREQDVYRFLKPRPIPLKRIAKIECAKEVDHPNEIKSVHAIEITSARFYDKQDDMKKKGRFKQSYLDRFTERYGRGLQNCPHSRQKLKKSRIGAGY